ncbi:MAG: UDP-N-acetylmuramate dehydrogenase [Eubacteriales bacterium]|nr:UDP-N-acetylmuramate dehydrogenase [Eubacteriales bacterium]
MEHTRESKKQAETKDFAVSDLNQAYSLTELWPDLEAEPDCLESLIKEAVPLAPLSYYRAGGVAQYFAKPETLAEFTAVLKAAKERNLETVVLGLGSNVLFAEEGIDGLVIMTTGLDRIFTSEDLIWAEAGVLLADFVAYTVDRSLGDYSSLVGIPGTIGGALFMNAGAYDCEISKYLDAVLLYAKESSDCFIYRPKPGDFSYRMSFLQNSDYLALAAAFKLEPQKQSELMEKLAEVQMKRRNAQPLLLPSCGSAFKRPPGHYVGKLISDLGLKGVRHGQVGVSAKHAGFIVNYGGATASEIRAFFNWVRKEVKEAYEIDLVPEVRYLGKWPEEFSKARVELAKAESKEQH